MSLMITQVFVMDAWGLNYSPSAQELSVRMLADTCGNLMRAMGMTMEKVVKVLGNERAFRSYHSPPTPSRISHSPSHLNLYKLSILT